MSVTPTWFDRDLPVLETTIQLFEEMGHPGALQVRQIAERCGMEAAAVFAALLAMQHEYVTLNLVLAGGDPNPQMVTGVTADARRAVGQWPSVDTLSDRLVAALQEAAEQESDPVKKTKLRSAVDAVTGMSRDIFVGVVTTAVTGALPHH